MRAIWGAIALALVLLFTLLAARPASAPPPPSGDWIVTGHEVVDNATVTAHGSVYVAAGATLVLDNATPRINGTSDGQRRLQVNATGTLVLRLTVTVEAPWDGDRDGLPDAWEAEHFGGLAEGPTGDPDGDGWTNGEEWRRGTDPNVADRNVAAADFPWWTLVGYAVLPVLLVWWWRRVRRGRRAPRGSDD